MPVDPSIALSFRPTPIPQPVDLARSMQGASEAWQVDAQRRTAQSANALKQLFSDPASIDASGNPTPNALRQVMSISPEAGMKMRQNMLVQQQHQLQSDVTKTKLFAQKLDLSHQAEEGGLIAYEQAMKNGMPEAQAREVGQQAFGSARDAAMKSGMFSEQEQGVFPTNFDPMRARSNTLTYKEWMSAQEKQRSDARQDRSEAREDARLKLDEKRLAQGTPAGNAERDVETIANDQIAAEEKKLGRPLTPAEGAAIRQTARIAPKVEAKKAITAAAGGLLEDDEVKLMAQQYLAGDKSIFANLGRGAQGAENIKKVRGEIAREAAERGWKGEDIAAKMAEFAGLTAGERTLGNRTAQVGMAVAEAKQMAPLALAASDKVNRSSYPTLNTILLAGERGTGSEDAVRLGIATNSLINIYARAISPTGVPTVSDKDHARELLSSAWSKGQYNAGVDQLLKEMNAASQAPGAVREEFRDAVKTGKDPVSGAIPTIDAKPPSGGSATLPPEARAFLKPGHVVQLKGPDGSVSAWKLDANGNPIQVK